MSFVEVSDHLLFPICFDAQWRGGGEKERRKQKKVKIPQARRAQEGAGQMKTKKQRERKKIQRGLSASDAGNCTDDAVVRVQQAAVQQPF